MTWDTPFYIAARLGYSEVLAELLKESQIVGGSLAGPNGRTALHATVDSLNQETVKVLLEHDRGAAYIRDKDDKTALHLVAAAGSFLIMNIIGSHCPDCCEQVDNKGWNALHYAAANGDTYIIQSSIKNKRLGMLLNDIDGNTPAHLLAACGSIVPGTNWLAINKQEHDCLDIFPVEARVGTRMILKMRECLEICRLVHIKYDSISNWEKAKESHLIVATLIATVTFLAAFTLSGGLKSDDDGGESSTTILRKNGAFKTSRVSDALFLSLSVVFMHFLLPLCQSPPRFTFLFVSSMMILCAIGAMVVAFVSGTYTVLSPSPGLAMTTFGLAFFLLAYFFYARGKKAKPMMQVVIACTGKCDNTAYFPETNATIIAPIAHKIIITKVMNRKAKRDGDWSRGKRKCMKTADSERNNAKA